MTNPASTADDALARALASGKSDVTIGRAFGVTFRTDRDHNAAVAFARRCFALGQQAAVPSVTNDMVDRLQVYVEGEFDGLALADHTARRMLRYTFGDDDAATTPPAPDAGEEGAR